MFCKIFNKLRENILITRLILRSTITVPIEVAMQVDKSNWKMNENLLCNEEASLYGMIDFHYFSLPVDNKENVAKVYEEKMYSNMKKATEFSLKTACKLSRQEFNCVEFAKNFIDMQKKYHFSGEFL